MSTLSAVTASDGMFKGEAKSLVFTITNSVGAAQNIAGWTISWRLAATQGGAAALSKTGAITDGPGGITTVSLAAGDTSGLSAGTYFYSIRRTDSGSEAELAYGEFVLQARYVV